MFEHNASQCQSCYLQKYTEDKLIRKINYSPNIEQSAGNSFNMKISNAIKKLLPALTFNALDPVTHNVDSRIRIPKEFLFSMAMVLMIFARAPWKSLLISLLDLQTQPAVQFSNDINQLQIGVCKHYENIGFFKVNLEPWQVRPKYTDIRSSYIKQVVQTSDGSETDNLFDLFSWTNEDTRRYLLIAEHGEGKTAIVKHATFKWCKTVLENEYQWFQKLKLQTDYLMGKKVTIMKETYPHKMLRFFWKIIPNSIIQGLFNFLLTSENNTRMPHLLLSYELNNICSLDSIYDVLKSEDPILLNIEKTIETMADDILFVFDGYEEFANVNFCADRIKFEVESKIGSQSSKDFNVVCTSRYWKAHEILTIKENDFQKLSFVPNQMTLKTRNEFIHNFFSNMKEDLSEVMINAIDNKQNIIPSGLLQNKGMIIYICKIFSYNFDSRLTKQFYSEEKFLNNLLNLMQLTHNAKYPLEPMTDETLIEMKKMIIDNKLNYEQVPQVFADHSKQEEKSWLHLVIILFSFVGLLAGVRLLDFTI